jgi:hypothetical protein
MKIISSMPVVVDEADEVALGDGAVEGAEREADLEVIPVVAGADRLHEPGFSLRALCRRRSLSAEEHPARGCLRRPQP